METLDIRLLGKEYQVACRPEERDALLAAVALLDDRLAEVARRTGSSGERLAIMTALNIVHEHLQQQRGGGFDLPAAKRRIGLMTARLDGVLAQQEKLF
ncbi:cell division protein ZapA [Pseudothauera nasutitermitis]|uniref:Cell division protein ZapA n=1 Tax=Pseudothauera nasutitermitis TaxID=2565930 RepID=A0A4S4AWH9_9RHOO|nr:cell division protein ZapA [Pseudothauera nasutitermitis]THF63990.1 cell division protein ZapA [Pseudothauera nasutitermitis]